MVGKVANYRRPEIPSFQQMKNFIDVQPPTALFRPVMDSSQPFPYRGRLPCRLLLALVQMAYISWALKTSSCSTRYKRPSSYMACHTIKKN
jgi:hypothetical protein